VQARCLRFSVFQHLARVRRVYNLFEDDDVVGITNYLDFGAAVEAPLAPAAQGDGNGAVNGGGADGMRFEAAAAWQARPCASRAEIPASVQTR
jgi:hypothetical protein